MGIEKMRLLEKESINTDIEIAIKRCKICLEFQATQLKGKPIQHDIAGRPCETVGTDIFMLNTKKYFCILDYHCKFPVMKLIDGLNADSLIKTCKVTFTEYTFLRKMVSDDSKILFQSRSLNSVGA